MAYRNRKLASQLGKKVKDPGAHIPHAAVALIRRRNTRDQAFNEKLEIKNGGKKGSLLRKYNPFPMEFLPGSM